MKRGHGFENFWGGSLSGGLISILWDLALKLWVLRLIMDLLPCFCSLPIPGALSLLLTPTEHYCTVLLLSDCWGSATPWYPPGSSWRISSLPKPTSPCLLYLFAWKRCCLLGFALLSDIMDWNLCGIPWFISQTELFAGSYVFQGMNLVPNPTFQFTWLFCQHLRCAEPIPRYNKSRVDGCPVASWYLLLVKQNANSVLLFFHLPQLIDNF